MGVGIPGADERGVALCAAMGVTAGDATAKMRVMQAMFTACWSNPYWKRTATRFAC